MRPRRSQNKIQRTSIQEEIVAMLPDILIPLVKILIEVTTIPGDPRQKIKRVNEVVKEAIKKTCPEPEGYTTDEEDEDYQISQSESEISEESVEHISDMELSDLAADNIEQEGEFTEVRSRRARRQHINSSTPA